MLDRRRVDRAPIDLFFNKYVDGYPHVCRARDISSSGLRVSSLHEPESASLSSTLELQLPGDDETLWVWAEQVWRRGRDRALRFVALHARDRQRLCRWLSTQ